MTTAPPLIVRFIMVLFFFFRLIKVLMSNCRKQKKNGWGKKYFAKRLRNSVFFDILTISPLLGGKTKLNPSTNKVFPP